MPKGEFDMETSLSPEKVIRALIAFAERRPDTWPPLWEGTYKVGSIELTTVRVQEAPGWSERGIVRLEVVEGRFCKPPSFVQVQLTRKEGGSKLRVQWEWTPVGIVRWRVVALTGAPPVRAPVEASLNAGLKKAMQQAQVGSYQEQSKKQKARWWHSTTNILFGVGVLLPVVGFLLVALYARSTTGPHLAYFSTGTFVGLAAFFIGSLLGFLFGVPRAVSAPTSRLATPVTPQREADSTANSGSVSDTTSTATVPQHYQPSTNLTEVSDWLTKVLLGAGLVQLGRLGRPVGRLLDTVARGLQPDTPGGSSISATSRVAGGALVIFYICIGFLDGYIITTLWYQRRLERIRRATQ